MGISYFLELPSAPVRWSFHYPCSEGNCSQENSGALRILNYNLVSCVKLNVWFSKFNFALLDSKKFIPKIPTGLVCSLRTTKLWLNVTLPMRNLMVCSPRISKFFTRDAECCKICASNWFVGNTRLQNATAGSRIQNKGSFHSLNLY